MASRPYLGQGTKHPHSIDQFGKIELQSDSALIKQSLEILFAEPIGSEFYREHYGSNIKQAMFEPNDSILSSLLDYYILDAIQKWERRIQVSDIKYQRDAGQTKFINVMIVYRIKQSSEIDSFIFPYYTELKN